MCVGYFMQFDGRWDLPAPRESLTMQLGSDLSDVPIYG